MRGMHNGLGVAGRFDQRKKATYICVGGKSVKVSKKAKKDQSNQHQPSL